MGIDIRIHLTFTPTQRRIMRGAVVVGVVVGALGVGLAIAAPHQWKPSDPLVAADLNGLGIVTKNQKQYSLGATYCGKTPPVTGDIAGTGSSNNGYAAAKSMCEAASECGTSLSAHMCTSEELIRSRSLGITIERGWFSSGVSAPGSNTECLGWTSTLGNPNGSVWALGKPSYDSCSNMQFVLCCD